MLAKVDLYTFDSRGASICDTGHFVKIILFGVVLSVLLRGFYVVVFFPVVLGAAREGEQVFQLVQLV